MKTYKIPCQFKTWGVVEVKADNLKHALMEAQFHCLRLFRPSQTWAYVKNSWRADKSTFVTYNPKLAKKELKENGLL